jgi:hypothetical protein
MIYTAPERDRGIEAGMMNRCIIGDCRDSMRDLIAQGARAS